MDALKIGDRTFSNRLFIGTGKFEANETMADAIIDAKVEVVTVAVRRVGKDVPSPADAFDRLNKNCLLVPNTSGAHRAEEAVRIAEIAAAMGLEKWVKLELTPEPRHLLPDPIETLKAAEVLTNKGFTVLPYINADPVLAKRLEDVGVAAVMPLGAPIGTNMGLRTKDQLRIIIEEAQIPVVVDAGLGAPSHAAEAMELGADAVLVNTAVAVAPDPCIMAKAFSMAVEAGRMAYTSGLAKSGSEAQASSPLTGFLFAEGK